MGLSPATASPSPLRHHVSASTPHLDVIFELYVVMNVLTPNALGRSPTMTEHITLVEARVQSRIGAPFTTAAGAIGSVTRLTAGQVQATSGTRAHSPACSPPESLQPSVQHRHFLVLASERGSKLSCPHESSEGMLLTPPGTDE